MGNREAVSLMRSIITYPLAKGSIALIHPFQNCNGAESLGMGSLPGCPSTSSQSFPSPSWCLLCLRVSRVLAIWSLETKGPVHIRVRRGHSRKRERQSPGTARHTPRLKNSHIRHRYKDHTVASTQDKGNERDGTAKSMGRAQRRGLQRISPSWKRKTL